MHIWSSGILLMMTSLYVIMAQTDYKANDISYGDQIINSGSRSGVVLVNQPIPEVVTSKEDDYKESNENDIGEGNEEYGTWGLGGDEETESEDNYLEKENSSDESDEDEDSDEDEYSYGDESDEDEDSDEDDYSYGDESDEHEDSDEDDDEYSFGADSDEDEDSYGAESDEDEDSFGAESDEDEEDSGQSHPGGPGRKEGDGELIEVIPSTSDSERQYLSVYNSIQSADAFARVSRLMVDTMAEIAQGPQAWPGVMRTYGHHLLDSTVDNGFRRVFKGLKQQQARRRKNPLKRRKPSFLSWLQFFPQFGDEEEEDDDYDDDFRRRYHNNRYNNRYYQRRRRLYAK